MNWDFNRDGAITISDMAILAKYIACFPGNFLMNLLSMTSVGRFFEVSLGDDYSTGRWIVSVVIWIVLYGTIASAISESKTHRNVS